MFLTAAAPSVTPHLQPLISDLGLILITAGFAVLLFKKIKQPLVLGYLIAGFLAGNHFDFFPSVKDTHSVEIWAQIGVIFLLFSLGLEFSFKKLVKVGGTASITAITQIITMVALGFIVGKLMGWKNMDCLFLGVILSISSTTIILKAFDELGVKAQKFAGNVIGALIVQDILAILMMVLLSTIAVSQQVSGSELFYSVLKLVFFLTIWFVGGIFFVPTLLKNAKHLLSDEMLLILSIALCLVMVTLAANVGFSPALGAFIMGSIIAETTQAEHIENLVKPVKDLFGAVFFVSVGMMINPDTLVDYAFPVVILTLVVIIGQSTSSAIGSLLSGQPLKQAVQAGVSLSQIGEFSFIIATLGLSLDVTSDFLYPTIVAVSAITTFTTPYMVKLGTPLSVLLEKKLPRKWIKNIQNYSANAEAIKTVSTWQIVLQSFLFQIILHSIIIIGIIVLSTRYILPLVEGSKFGHAVGALITLVIVSPFLWALSLRKIAVDEVSELFERRKQRGPIVVLIFFRMVLGLFFVGFILNNFFSPGIAFLALIGALLAYFIFPKQLHARYHKIERHFLSNLNDREIAKEKKTRRDLTPWDGHMATFDIADASNLAGKTLEELQMREKIGINIAFIKRGEITINVPSRNERLFPGDEICVIGTDFQVKKFKKYLDQNEIEAPESVEESDIVLQHLELKNESFIGKSIRESQIREKTSGLVVGIEREGRRMLNPDSHLILEQGDILWVVGDKKLLASLAKGKLN
ncbi:Kef-type K+ transport system, putative NAD-binding component [Flavobacterium enshiense DK69]|uniref:Sodium:proton antiporter n=1 Tax=Flavobacterium enshiense DK69 TaxID=1107311 RepID=V6SFM7_9FLAO|nr:cation:proton antiporter [Flavobacterium enshiense]ESU25072.1 Kef-type K+ transport system, putative NAD-binding component [Flavobacterium enshiense DK69]KGO97027.1 sodium:proton antiporter [Flavobacterium enshiense DK69]